MRHIARTALFFTTSFLVAGFCTSAFGQKCLEYGPTVSLKGVIRSQIFPGRPNYESIKSGDEKERAIILTIATPICTTASDTDYFDVPEKNVRKLQLVITESAHWKTVERRLGRRVVIRGTLFHAHTGHHRTRVLIIVTGIRHA